MVHACKNDGFLAEDDHFEGFLGYPALWSTDVYGMCVYVMLCTCVCNTYAQMTGEVNTICIHRYTSTYIRYMHRYVFANGMY